mmetsp:Transcript_42064/g.40333  ORF Transcript_42064/g.40333 Transcript_42064/m.40333 type:complete len:126 (+) Transcript_42064:316-693(+)|eukprot:CAMPEP_0170556594 /NCGR_PEP_ID=MMETSP0211-20121228/17674_1 /TAXON_ID=311385 /ORGANISM="Pseudokeronopsis sp., Strain OXSARD2" /LENGTH=125 /DNA_ID=CAMNT_0010867027 /DNA_START=305 /DNA_END=682 /DNA_ORIENTATION=+
MLGQYDESNQLHEKHLKALYKDLFILPTEENPSFPERLLSEQWIDVGFQGKNPRTDFRGGGLLSLLCLRYFVTNYREYFDEMLRDTTSGFFLSISSINITHTLIIYFFMNKDEVQLQHKKLRAGR